MCEHYLYLHAERGVVCLYGGGGQVGQTEGSTAVDIHHLITPPGYIHTHIHIHTHVSIDPEDTEHIHIRIQPCPTHLVCGVEP